MTNEQAKSLLIDLGTKADDGSLSVEDVFEALRDQSITEDNAKDLLSRLEKRRSRAVQRALRLMAS